MELGGGGGGESASKRARLSSDDVDADAVAGEDRLSALPIDVLVLILLKLSIRAAAQTSILARSWRHIWVHLPELHFCEAPEPHRLRDILDTHRVPLLDLHVRTDCSTPESLAVWLPAAARRVTGYLTLLHYGPVKDAREGGDEDAAQRGAFELPCFDKATSISLILGFHGVAVPPTAIFTRLTDLHLRRVWFHGPGELGDAVSWPRCPYLQRLAISDARGVGDLTIRSESLLVIGLRNLLDLSQLTVVAPALKELTAVFCFLKNPPVATISAPQLTKLDWRDKYDPSSVHLGKMAHLRWLGTHFYIAYGHIGLLHNHSCLSLLQRFEGIQTLSLQLAYPRTQDIGNYQYMMEDMTMLPDITFLCLTVIANGHSFKASAFHVLRLCTGIRSLTLNVVATGSKAQTLCSSDCICHQPANWETEELLLKQLEEVEIVGWRGTEHEVAFVKRLFIWGTKLKEMTIKFFSSTSEIEAKEMYKIFQSLSRPGVCMKFYLRQKDSMVLYAPKE